MASSVIVADEASGLGTNELVSRFGNSWRLADHLDNDLIDARNQLFDRLDAATLGGLAAGTAADPITKPLGISEPRH
jgi:hypothetical protein